MLEDTKPFVNRKDAIELFRQLIDFENLNRKPFLNFYGISGIGKSFLIDHLKATTLKNIPTVHVTFEPGASDYDYNSFINRIIQEIYPRLSTKTLLDEFKTKQRDSLQQYHLQRKNILSTSDDSNIENEKNIQMANVRGEATQKLLIQTRRMITQEFLDMIAKSEACPLLIILDAVENLLPEMQVEKQTSNYADWLIRFLLQFNESWSSVRILFSGRTRITYDILQAKCQALELRHLPEDDVMEYLGHLKMTDEALVEAIYSLTDGYSLSVAIAGELWQESERNLVVADLETEDFRAAYQDKMVPELLIRRILERTDERLKPLIQWSGLLRYFTYQMLNNTLLPELREEDFQHFVRYSFIKKIGKHYQYHAELRRLVTANYLKQHPQNFHRDCAIIYHYFASQEHVEQENSNQERDERFYYGIYGQVEGVFDEWKDTCHLYHNTGQTERLKMLVQMIDEIQQTFSQQEQAAIYLIKGRYYAQLSEWDTALAYYQKSERSTIEVHDKAELGSTYNNIGEIYRMRGEWAQALEFYQKGEQIALKVDDKALLGRIYNNIGLIYGNKGKLDTALAYYQKSELFAIKGDDEAGLGPTYNNIGEIYRIRGELDQALEFYQKSEQITLHVHDKTTLGTTYNNVGMVYSDMGDVDTALAYYQKGGQIALEVGDTSLLGTIYTNTGLIYYNKREWDTALAYYQKSEQITLEAGDKVTLGVTYHNIGAIYDDVGEWDKALEYYQKSERIAIEIGNKVSLGYISFSIAKIYYQRDNEKAIEYIDQSVAIFTELEAQYELGIVMQSQEAIHQRFG